MSRLLLENGCFLLLESGFALLLENDDQLNAFPGIVDIFGAWDFVEAPAANAWPIQSDMPDAFPFEPAPTSPDWELTP